METQQEKHTISISIDLDDILQEIYAASAWHAAHDKSVYQLTDDNRAMLRLKIREGYDHIYSRISGYIEASNYNPNIDHANITLTLVFRHECADTLAAELQATIIHALSNFALMRYYGGNDTYYNIAWHKYEAQLLLAFVRDANYDYIRA
jgi:hypothetical protein